MPPDWIILVHNIIAPSGLAPFGIRVKRAIKLNDTQEHHCPGSEKTSVGLNCVHHPGVTKMGICAIHFRRIYRKIIKAEEVWATSRGPFWEMRSNTQCWIHGTLVCIKEDRK